MTITSCLPFYSNPLCAHFRIARSPRAAPGGRAETKAMHELSDLPARAASQMGDPGVFGLCNTSLYQPQGAY